MIESELPVVAADILVSIAREVPEYARPLEGAFGHGVRTGVTEALRQFVALIRDPQAGRGPGREVYLALGRGELIEGRTLDSLQSAYRVGARVAWRRVAAAARRADLDPEVQSLLAEAIFAYIDELSADSVEGYAEAQAEMEGERQRRQRNLVALLLADPPAAEPAIRTAAQAAGWPPPRSAAALACREEELSRAARRLPPDVLTATVQGTGCIVISDPTGPGRRKELAHAVGSGPAALGPAGSPADLADSWALALATLRAAEAGVLAADRMVLAEEHLSQLLLSENQHLVERIGGRRLQALDALTSKMRRRLEKTALAYVQQQGNAAATARALQIHPQTVRYRLARLRELLGDALDEPDARFELEISLRARIPDGLQADAAGGSRGAATGA